jgi:hypothetical protein
MRVGRSGKTPLLKIRSHPQLWDYGHRSRHGAFAPDGALALQHAGLTANVQTHGFGRGFPCWWCRTSLQHMLARVPLAQAQQNDERQPVRAASRMCLPKCRHRVHTIARIRTKRAGVEMGNATFSACSPPHSASGHPTQSVLEWLTVTTASSSPTEEVTVHPTHRRHGLPGAGR